MVPVSFANSLARGQWFSPEKERILEYIELGADSWTVRKVFASRE